jgi:hypothetical protein
VGWGIGMKRVTRPAPRIRAPSPAARTELRIASDIKKGLLAKRAKTAL